ncbi:MAG: PepSY-like domain-containing protein [Bacteroidota bacterium]
MKNIFVLAVVFSLVSVSAFSQKNAPGNVKKEFAKKYASAQSVKWDSEEANEWEAEFSMNGKKMSACFDNSAKWLESETAISEKEVPVAVLNTLNKDFQGYKKGPVEIFESPAMKGFEMSLKKGEKSLEVIFDSNGIILKKTDLKEDDEKDEKN